MLWYQYQISRSCLPPVIQTILPSADPVAETTGSYFSLNALDHLPLLEDIRSVDEENNDGEHGRDDGLGEQVPDVQILHEYVHEACVQGDAHDLHAEVERELDMQAVARGIFERPEFLQKKTDGERDEERPDGRDEIIDMEDVGKNVEHGEVDRERKAARNAKPDELRVFLYQFAYACHSAKSFTLKPAFAKRYSASVLNVWNEYTMDFGMEMDVCSSL